MIIHIDSYKGKIKMNTSNKKSEKIKELEKRLKNDNRTKEYTIADAEKLAGDVLHVLKLKKDEMPIPAIRIAKEFGLDVLEEPELEEHLSGNIYINGTTKDVYGTDKVIVVKQPEKKSQKYYFHQRFVIIHELAHYLIDYLGSDISKNKNLLFTEAYPEGGHESPKERRADRFAAELLMPTSHFRERYVHAMEESDSNLFYTIRYLSKYFEVKESCIEKRIQEVIR